MDVFAAGRVGLWLISLDGEMWPDTVNSQSDQEQFLRSPQEFPLEHLQDDMDDDFVLLLAKMLKKNPQERITVDQLKVRLYYVPNLC
jgi:hypothetical protein